MKLRNDLFVLDVETTGDNPFVHDILSLALVPVVDPDDAYSVHVRHNNVEWTDFSRENFAAFEREWKQSAVDPAAAYQGIEHYLLRKCPVTPVTLVGHNVGFDLAFLRKLATQAGAPGLGRISHRTIDTHTLLYVCWLQGSIPESALSSDGAFSAFGLDIEPERRHTALGDARATRLLVLQLLNRLVDHKDTRSLRRVAP